MTAVQRQCLGVSPLRRLRVLLEVQLQALKRRVVWLERWLVLLRLGRARFLILVSIFLSV